MTKPTVAVTIGSDNYPEDVRRCRIPGIGAFAEVVHAGTNLRVRKN